MMVSAFSPCPWVYNCASNRNLLLSRSHSLSVAEFALRHQQCRAAVHLNANYSSSTRQLVVSPSAAIYTNQKQRCRHNAARSSVFECKNDSDSDGAADDAHTDSRGKSRPPSEPPEPDPNQVAFNTAFSMFLAELTADVAFPGTLAIIAAFLLRIDPFGHFHLSYSVASSAILASAPWCLALIVLALGDFSEDDSPTVFVMDVAASKAGEVQGSSDKSGSVDQGMAERKRQQSSIQDSESNITGQKQPSALTRLKVALHSYQTITAAKRSPWQPSLELPLLLAKEFAAEMCLRAVCITVVLGWFRDRIQEAGNEMTGASLVSSATPLVLIAGAAFIVGVEAVQAQINHASVKVAGSLIADELSDRDEDRARKRRLDRLSSQHTTSADDEKLAHEALGSLRKDLNSGNNAILKHLIQRQNDVAAVFATYKVASFSLLASLFMSTGNMAFSWVASVMLSGTQLACQTVRRAELEQRQADKISSLKLQTEAAISQAKARRDALQEAPPDRQSDKQQHSKEQTKQTIGDSHDNKES